MSYLGSELRRRGLRFGLYSSASEWTCQGLPGSLGFEAEDAASFAAWGVDYVKMDNCGAPHEPSPRERFARMGEALRAATTRPVVYAVCDWGVGEPWLWARGTADSWRVGGDSSARWGSLMASIDAMTGLGAYAGPGGWNDADMLEVGNSGLSEQEQEVQMALWCLFKTPLLISTDLRGGDEQISASRDRHALESCSPSSSSKFHEGNGDCVDESPPRISPRALSLLKNKNLLAIHGDSLRVAGDLVWRQAHKHVFAAPLAGDARVLVFLSCAVTDNVQPLTRMSMPWTRLGYASHTRLDVLDVLENRSLGVVSEGIVVEVLPHSVKVIVVRPEGRSEALVGERREGTASSRQPLARKVGQKTASWTPWADEPMFAPHPQDVRGYVGSLHVV
ncbi:hypothetical protein H632_c1436p1 [Helicosporidium sp. ATCC 50920]|nr:hypothetical protein H632_c1436p1 [Helicosporidium sp. ATCC 50920]|eukprot:KDD74278.1 hypothetical protein H632_c1436p1 [Helicosporidium sp. ATCC 50920]